MNKTEKRKLINKTFLTWVTENFPEYEISYEEGDGTFTLVNKNYPNEHMSYSRSSHDVCAYGYSPAEILEHESIFNAYIETILIPEINRLEKISKLYLQC